MQDKHTRRQKKCTNVVVINDFSWAKGGASSLALLNAKLVAQEGLKVDFISADDTVNDELLKLGITCHNLAGNAIDPSNQIQGLISGIHNKKALKFLKKFIEDHDNETTIYHLHGWSKILSPSIFLALKKVSSRLIIHAHDYFPVCPNGAFINYQTNSDCSLKPLSAACLLSNCDQRSYSHKLWRYARSSIRSVWFDFSKSGSKVILLHPSMTNHFLSGDFTEQNLTTLSNPVTPYSSSRIKAEENEKFVFIGRVVPEKGADIFLRAAKIANVKTKVIGTGQALEALRKEFPDTEFVGWQDKQGILNHVKEARAVILPSRMRETFGLVGVESIGSGLPIIVTDHSALADDIKNLQFGDTIEFEGVNQLAKLMNRYVESNELIEEMSVRGNSEWQKLALTPESWKNQLINIYDEQINQ